MNMDDWTIIARFLCLLTASAWCISAVTSLTCLQCDEISHPRYCQVVAVCKPGEVCFAEGIATSDHMKAYRLGCALANTAVCVKSGGNRCSECCNGNLCNAHACGESGYPAQRGPACYSCKTRRKGEPCNSIEHCNLNEVCYASERTLFGDTLVDRGCAYEHLCDVDPGIIGKRAIPHEDVSPSCRICCKADLCNHVCSVTTETTAHVQTSPTTTTTTVTATTRKPITVQTTTGITPTGGPLAPRDCYDILKSNHSRGDGLYTIHIVDDDGLSRGKQVFCNMTAGGWLVFQYRYDTSLNFRRNFTEYENGFGQWPGEFWLGLKWLHWITLHTQYELKINMRFAGYHNSSELLYKLFKIGPREGYILHVGWMEGDTYDSLSYNNGQPFLTYDRDNKDHCAQSGGWWYNRCTVIDLNENRAEGFIVEHNSTSFSKLWGSSMSIKPYTFQ